MPRSTARSILTEIPFQLAALSLSLQALVKRVRFELDKLEKVALISEVHE